MKKTLLTGLILTGFIATSMALISGVSAADRLNKQDNPNFPGKTAGHERMLEAKADVLGITLDELKGELENRTLREVFEASDISLEELHQKMRDNSVARWQERGLSDEEIQERIEWQNAKRAEGAGDCNPDGSNRMGRNAGGFRK